MISISSVTVKLSARLSRLATVGKGACSISCPCLAAEFEGDITSTVVLSILGQEVPSILYIILQVLPSHPVKNT